ncbi:MAG: ABC transporter ATP-binding protein [Firmicutes bacterium]|nr:ABC transporter ATP-binding protein [Bacillota bacterium]
MQPLLEVKNLKVVYDSASGAVQAVRDVSLELRRGEVLALVGESGSGKSALAKALMRLLPPSASVSGEVRLNGADILHLPERNLRELRGKAMGMIFQDPQAVLNPVLTVRRQIAEAVRLHDPQADTEQRVRELLQLVEIADAERCAASLPHQLSGGMRQRVVLAIALAAQPQLLIADEPTTSLDVTVQAQILDLLKSLQERLNMATLLISHDLSVVARLADRVAVMYAGKIVEIGTAEEIFYQPAHPYTWALLRSLPGFSADEEELYALPGMPPTLIDPPAGDAFAPRNEYALAIDYEQMPPLFRLSETHFAATWLLDARAPRIAPPLQGRCGE